MTITTLETTPRALLISIRTPHITIDEIDESLAELQRLVTTLGFTVLATQTQRQTSTKRRTVLGTGKLQELARITGDHEKTNIDDSLANIDEQELTEFLNQTNNGPQANVVVFDCELSPRQLRNVEDALGVKVFDRSGIIIEIFSRHARTRTARLQVELARLTYLAPRVRSEYSGDHERHSGRGSGETPFAIERRRIRDKQAEIRREIKSIENEMQEQRSSRAEELTVALVGYTNAGKSSLMRALTEADVLVEDKLFATLDTTVRLLSPATYPPILLSDTVGFIKKLPHDLIASFHSTLLEAKEADLLLYVVDAADKNFSSQLSLVEQVLQQLQIDSKNRLLVLNKVDCLPDTQRNVLSNAYPSALQICAHNGDDIALLHQKIQDALADQMISACFNIPYNCRAIIGDVHSKMRVIEEIYHEGGIRLTVQASSISLQRLNKKLYNLGK
ncbi:GTPase HflX [Psychromonas sp. MME2]|uniref:GTPase HflX n=1 Tax=unclassified Psychromonas TaxID=2614957 RepID=UPI00339CD50F